MGRIRQGGRQATQPHDRANGYVPARKPQSWKRAPDCERGDEARHASLRRRLGAERTLEHDPDGGHTLTCGIDGKHEVLATQVHLPSRK